MSLTIYIGAIVAAVFIGVILVVASVAVMSRINCDEDA